MVQRLALLVEVQEVVVVNRGSGGGGGGYGNSTAGAGASGYAVIRYFSISQSAFDIFIN